LFQPWTSTKERQFKSKCRISWQVAGL